MSRSGRDLDSADLEETAELGPGAKNVLDLKLQGMEEGAMRLEQEAGARRCWGGEGSVVRISTASGVSPLPPSSLCVSEPTHRDGAG